MNASIPRRQLLASAAAGLATAALPAWSQGYPSRPVKLVVGSPPGGPSDFLARTLGDSIGPALGQSFVVENRPGASGTLAADAVVRSTPDGHTLVLSGQSVVTTRHLMKLNYDPVADLQPVAMMGAGAFVVVAHPSLPVRSIGELVALARSKPGSISYASGGNGSSGHLCTETFSAHTGIRMLHVPYKGDGQGMTDLLAGQVQLMFTAPNVAMAQVKAGKLRLLGVTTRDRVPSIDAPSLHESGITDFEYLGWVILFAPAATPKSAVETLATAWNKARATPAVRGKLEEMAMLPPERIASGDALVRFVKAEDTRLGKVIRDANIRMD